MKEIFTKTVHDFQPFTIFAKIIGIQRVLKTPLLRDRLQILLLTLKRFKEIN